MTLSFLPLALTLTLSPQRPMLDDPRLLRKVRREKIPAPAALQNSRTQLRTRRLAIWCFALCKRCWLHGAKAERAQDSHVTHPTACENEINRSSMHHRNSVYSSAITRWIVVMYYNSHTRCIHTPFHQRASSKPIAPPFQSHLHAVRNHKVHFPIRPCAAPQNPALYPPVVLRCAATSPLLHPPRASPNAGRGHKNTLPLPTQAYTRLAMSQLGMLV